MLCNFPICPCFHKLLLNNYKFYNPNKHHVLPLIIDVLLPRWGLLFLGVRFLWCGSVVTQADVYYNGRIVKKRGFGNAFHKNDTNIFPFYSWRERERVCVIHVLMGASSASHTHCLNDQSNVEESSDHHCKCKNRCERRLEWCHRVTDRQTD